MTTDFDEVDLARLRARRTVKWRPGCDQHVRLNFATSRALLEQIVEAMGAAVRSHATTG